MAQLCLGCMQPKESQPICEHCGYDDRSENLSHQLTVGTMLQNRYLIGRVLGQGGFGITYIGWEQHLSIPVAIKEYFPGGVAHRNTRWSKYITCDNGTTPGEFAKHRERFLKEAHTLSQLSHIPEIVQIRDFFSDNDTAYIVMEYVQGITLSEHVKSLNRPLIEQEALAIMEPILRALQKVHDQGLIHRDISPDNIMLPRKGGIKIIDFGTVRYTADSGRSQSTEAILKPGFAPMEQYNVRGNIGTWTDVYAICATFHYLLTGKVPPDVHDRLDTGEQLTLLRSNPNISKKLIEALEEGMRLRVPDRLQTIDALYDLIYAPRKAAPSQEVKPPVSKAPKPEPKKEQSVPGNKPHTKAKPAKKRTLRVAAAILLILCFAGFFCIRSVPYLNGLFLMNTGRYKEAIVVFESIQDQVDTSRQIAQCREGIREDAYEHAVKLKEKGQYAEAISAFLALGNYKDSSKQVVFCQNAIYEETYSDALALIDSQKYEEAIEKLETIKNYKDSSDLIEYCGQKQGEQRKASATKKMNGKDYRNAINEFKEAEKYGLDCSSEIRKCETSILQANDSPYMTSGNPAGKTTNIGYSIQGNVKVHSLTRVKLDNNCVRFTIDFTIPENDYVSFFNPPNGTAFMYAKTGLKEGRHTVTFDLLQEDVTAGRNMTIKFGKGRNEADSQWIFINYIY